jgi:hypothetical protein
MDLLSVKAQHSLRDAYESPGAAVFVPLPPRSDALRNLPIASGPMVAESVAGFVSRAVSGRVPVTVLTRSVSGKVGTRTCSLALTPPPGGGSARRSGWRAPDRRIGAGERLGQVAAVFIELYASDMRALPARRTLRVVESPTPRRKVYS